MDLPATGHAARAGTIGGEQGHRIVSPVAGNPCGRPGEDDMPQAVVQIQISAGKLESLFASGDLCVADIRCLDAESKASVWKMCLTSCANRMHCNFKGMKSCLGCGWSPDN